MKTVHLNIPVGQGLQNTNTPEGRSDWRAVLVMNIKDRVSRREENGDVVPTAEDIADDVRDIKKHMELCKKDRVNPEDAFDPTGENIYALPMSQQEANKIISKKKLRIDLPAPEPDGEVIVKPKTKRRPAAKTKTDHVKKVKNAYGLFLQTQEQARTYVKRHIERVLDLGDALLKAKADVKHGEWTSFLRESGVSIRNAQNFMLLAKNREMIELEIEFKNADSAYLTIDKALKLIPRKQEKKTDQEWFMDDWNKATKSGNRYVKLIASLQTQIAHKDVEIDPDALDTSSFLETADRVKQFVTGAMKSASAVCDSNDPPTEEDQSEIDDSNLEALRDALRKKERGLKDDEQILSEYIRFTALPALLQAQEATNNITPFINDMENDELRRAYLEECTTLQRNLNELFDAVIQEPKNALNPDVERITYEAEI